MTQTNPRSAAPWSPNTRRGVLLVATLSGVAGAVAGCAPTGGTIADHTLTGITAALVTFCAAGASGGALVLGAAIVVAAGGSWQLHLVGVVALLATALLERSERQLPVVRALVGAALVQSVLRLPWDSPIRGSAFVALVVMVIIVVSGMRRTAAPARRVVAISVGVISVVAFVAVVGAAYAVLRGRTLLESGEASARAGVDAARAGDRVGAAEQFKVAGQRFDEAEHHLGSWLTLPARQLPLVGPQLRTLDSIASFGARTIPLARSTVTKIDPDRLRLLNGRLDLATLASYSPVFDELATRTRAVRAELERLPRTWLVPVLDHQLTRFESTVARADDSAQTAAEAVRLAPALLGAHGARTYFIAFVTPAEARGSGGLMANYGVLTAVNGRVHLEKVGRGPDLDYEGTEPKHLTGPPDYLARYNKFQPAESWTNVTMSPDFPSVGQVISELYPQSGGRRLDGVIMVDPFAMERLLSLSGPVRVAGLPLSIDASNAVSFLLRDEYTLIKDPLRRSDLLGDVAKAVFDRLTTGTSAQPSEIARVMSPVVDTEDFAMWMSNAREQTFIRDIGADAALPPVRGDSFGVIVQNGGGSKIENYLERTISYSATVTAATGRVKSHAVVALRNTSPVTGVPFYLNGNELGKPVGTSTLYVSIYSPFALRAATIDGRPFALLPERELGRNVYSSFVDIPPGGTRTVTVDLDGEVDLSKGTYHFDYIPQVLPIADHVDVSVRVPDGCVTGGSGRGAAPVVVHHDAHTAAVARSGTRGPWSADLEIRR